MFARTKRVEDVEKRVSDHSNIHKTARRHINALESRIRALESNANKVRVKLRDEDGNLLTSQKHPYGQATQRYTLVEIEDVLRSVFEHLGFDFSIEEREPERIRIEDEVVEFVVTHTHVE